MASGEEQTAAAAVEEKRKREEEAGAVERVGRRQDNWLLLDRLNESLCRALACGPSRDPLLHRNPATATGFLGLSLRHAGHDVQQQQQRVSKKEQRVDSAGASDRHSADVLQQPKEDEPTRVPRDRAEQLRRMLLTVELCLGSGGDEFRRRLQNAEQPTDDDYKRLIRLVSDTFDDNGQRKEQDKAPQMDALFERLDTAGVVNCRADRDAIRHFLRVKKAGRFISLEAITEAFLKHKHDQLEKIKHTPSASTAQVI